MTILISTGRIDWDQIEGNLIVVGLILVIAYFAGKRMKKRDDQDA